MQNDTRGCRHLIVSVLLGTAYLTGAGTTAALAEYDVGARWQPAVEHLQQGNTAVRIATVSTRNDMVTGGNVLVRISAENPLDLGAITVSVNGEVVTDAFRSEGETLLGLVDGLELGDNTITVSGVAGGEARLAVTNHPITGPLFAGPQQEPFICQTEDFVIHPDASLGAPIDEHCSIETRVEYFYHNGDSFEPLPDTTSHPDDVETVTISNGNSVPYIVRVEIGTINRSIYSIASLHDPVNDPDPSPFTTQPGWNDRAVYFYGGGCIRGYYRQGNGNVSAVLEDGWLREGYAAIHSTLNVAGNNCNTMLSAEVSAMTKEHFIETFGEPLFTIGTGSSGGSYQTQAITNSYPGILQGIVIGSVFADVTTTTLFTLADARLMHNYFNEMNDPFAFSPWQQRMISGFGTEGNITFLGTTGGALRMHPTESFHDTTPEELRYHPDSNPQGARSTVYDLTVNVYGTDEIGRAHRPLDNVGVQYGLVALDEGVIDAQMFLDLNERIGGFDLDLNPEPERMEADMSAIVAAYRTGLINDAGPLLGSTPIIDYRNYRDDRRDGDIHHLVHGFATRARLQASNADTYNHVMWFGGENDYSPDGQLTEAFRQMDTWLTAIAQDDSDTSLYSKVRMHRPADLEDACFSPGPSGGQRINETQRYQGTNLCSSAYYPAFPSTRQAAGGTLANDIVKCTLKPLDRSDYNVTFSADEWTRLQEIFPQGVCDFTRPGIGQVPSEPWLRYVE